MNKCTDKWTSKCVFYSLFSEITKRKKFSNLIFFRIFNQIPISAESVYCVVVVVVVVVVFDDDDDDDDDWG
jgi:uncharacterized membrane protein